MLERFSQLFKLRGGPEEELASARRQLDIAWRELGGQDGTFVTKEQISWLLTSELRTRQAETKAEITTTPLVDGLETAQDLDTIKSVENASYWLAKQKASWTKQLVLKKWSTEFEQRELKRRITACKCAIKLLTPSEYPAPIA